MLSCFIIALFPITALFVFVNVVKSLHDGMDARVLDQGSFSATINVFNGVKQGCVLAPTLFSIMFAMLIREHSMKQMTPAFT